MKQRILSIPLNVLLFLNTYSGTLRGTDSTMLSAFDSDATLTSFPFMQEESQ